MANPSPLDGSCVLTAAAEPLAGTAPHRRVWALVEHPGPWGRDAVLDAPWPTPSFGAALHAVVDAADVRLVLARRPGRRLTGTAPARPTVIVAVVGPGGWAGALRLDGPAAVTGLDWRALAAARSRPAGWEDSGEVWAVCTHGTRDTCCAVLGSPLAAALHVAGAAATWEISHSGGHRFAGVLLALPEGLCYGRVQPGDVPELVAARARGAVVPRLLRGRMHLTYPLQAGEVALLAHLGSDGLDAVVPVFCEGEGPVVSSVWRRPAAGELWRVDVEQVPIPDRPGSCGKRPEPAVAWRPGTPALLAPPGRHGVNSAP